VIPLLRAARARRTFGPDTTAYRLVNAEGDGLPDVTVDWFAGVAVLSLYRSFPEPEERQLVEAVAQVFQPTAVYLKRRPREARHVANVEAERVAPPKPEVGQPVEQLVALERGLKFVIRPGQGLSVGLYLDARDARAEVESLAKGRSVLNCFAYTCGFGVAARRGQASSVVNLDVSRKVLDWGAENARLNAQPVDPKDFIAGDVFDWLARFRKKGRRFGLVILDPPSFATTRKSRFSAASDYAELAEAATHALEPEGVLLACCNLATLPLPKFRGMVLEGIAAAGGSAREGRSFGPSPVDFPQGTLKCLVLEVSR
jgi:23S rRNA (cytosine1962-C5)-methyltransferase